MIDSHCHLADKKFNADLSDVIDRAVAAGVDRMICIADSLEEGERCIEIAERFDNVWATVGVHPHVSEKYEVGSTKRLKELVLSSEKVVAIGEIGLDYHYDNSPREVQRSVFKEQLEIAKELNLPAVLHNRESISDLKQIISEVDPPQLVLHCCTEKWDDVADFIERGYLLSFTGIATYPKSEDIRETIRHCPIEQLMIETDSPYLAPEGLRGKRCEPAYVVEVAKLVAALKGLSVEEIDTISTATTELFYSLAT